MFGFPGNRQTEIYVQEVWGGVASESTSVEAEGCRTGQRKSLSWGTVTGEPSSETVGSSAAGGPAHLPWIESGGWFSRTAPHPTAHSLSTGYPRSGVCPWPGWLWGGQPFLARVQWKAVGSPSLHDSSTVYKPIIPREYNNDLLFKNNLNEELRLKNIKWRARKGWGWNSHSGLKIPNGVSMPALYRALQRTNKPSGAGKLSRSQSKKPGQF